MRVIEQHWHFMHPVDGLSMLRRIELAGRTCYKSEDKVTEDSCIRFVRMLIRRGHESVLEHEKVTVKVVTNRGVSHELVRHRIASYSQESTRWVNYKEGITVVRPVWIKDIDRWSDQDTYTWILAMKDAEKWYQSLIRQGWKPEQARDVLPNALKTEVVVTMNLRQWRHFFRLRCAKDAHPQMRALALDMLRGFRQKIPVVFDDICEGEEEEVQGNE